MFTTNPPALPQHDRTTIPMVPCSDLIAECGYEPTTQTLVLRFHGAPEVYHVGDLSPEAYEAFILAESRDAHFAQHFADLPHQVFES